MSRARRVTHWLVRGVAGLAVLGLLGLIAAVLWLRTDSGNDALRRIVVDETNRAIGAPHLAIGGLHTDLFSRLSADDVVLVDSEGRELARVDHLALSYDLAGLLSRRLVVHSARLQGPRVRIAVLPDGRLDLLVALGIEPSTEPSRPWGGLAGHLIVERLEVADGEASYSDGDLQLGLSGVEGEAALEVQDRQADLVGLSLLAVVDPPDAGTMHLVGGLRYAAGDLVLDKLDLALGESSVVVDGRVEAVETVPVLGLDIGLTRLAPAQLALALGDSAPRQDLAGQLRLDGPFEALELGGRVEADAGALDVRGGLNLQSSPLQWSMVLGTERLDLQALLPAVTEPTVLAGRYAIDGRGVDWPGDLEASVQVDGGDQRLWGEPIQGLVVRSTLKEGRAVLERVAGTHGVGHFDLSGSVDIQQGKADVRGLVDVPALAALEPYGLAGVSGRGTFRGDVQADWSGEQPTVSADGLVHGSNLSWQGTRVAVLAGPVKASVEGQRIHASGTLALAGASSQGVGIGAGSADWSLDVFPRPQALALSARAELDVERVTVPDAQLRFERIHGSVDVRLLGEVVEQLATSLDFGPIILGEPEAWRVDGGTLLAEVRGDRIKTTASFTANGAPVFAAAATGDLASGEWRAEPVVVMPNPARGWTSARPITFRVTDDGLADLDLLLVQPENLGGRFEVKGSVTAAQQDVELDISGVDLTHLAELAELSARFRVDEAAESLAMLRTLRGMGAIRGHVTGDEGRLQLDVDLGIEDFGIEDLVMGADIAVRVEHSSDEVVFTAAVRDDEALLLSGGGRVPLVAGAVDCASEVDLRVSAPANATGRFGRVAPSLDLPMGRVSADLLVEGPACDPEIRAVAALNAKVGFDRQIGRIDLDVRREGEDLRVRGVLSQGFHDRIIVEGTGVTGLSQVLAHLLAGAPDPGLDLPRTWLSFVDVSLEPRDVPLSVLGSFVELPHGLNGRLAGGARLSGDPSNPELQGGLVLLDGRIGQAAVQTGLLSMGPGVEGGYDLGLSLDFVGDGDLQVTGSLPFALDLLADPDELLSRPGVSMTVSGQGVPLAALAGPVRGVERADGLLVVEGTVGGSLGAPEPDLMLRVRGGTLHYADTGVTYEDIRGGVRLTREDVVLERITLNTRQRKVEREEQVGRLSLSGSVDLAELEPIRLDLVADLDHFVALETPDARVVLSGDLTAVGPSRAFRIDGELTTSRSFLNLEERFFTGDANLRMHPDLQLHREQQVVQIAAAPDPWEGWEKVEADIELKLDRGLALTAEMPMETRYGRQFAQLSRMGLESRVDGQLRLLLHEGKEKVRGQVELVQGTATVMGKAFDVSDGVIAFAGDDYFNPILDIAALYQAGEYGTIEARIGGDVENVTLDLSSSEWGESDVMAILLFGAPMSETDSTTGQGRGALMSVALASVSGQIERAVGVLKPQLLDVEVGESSLNARVGYSLTEKVFVVAARTPDAGEGENRIEGNLEYIIGRNVYANLMVGDTQTSADVYWRWRF